MKGRVLEVLRVWNVRLRDDPLQWDARKSNLSQGQMWAGCPFCRSFSAYSGGKGSTLQYDVKRDAFVCHHCGVRGFEAEDGRVFAVLAEAGQYMPAKEEDE